MPARRLAAILFAAVFSVLATPASYAKEAQPDQAERSRSDAGSINELQTLIKDRQLLELRTTYNGQYGASLLFHPGTLTYYVTSFHDLTFSRVLKTTSDAKAQRNYRKYSANTEKQAQNDIDRMKLGANERYARKGP